MMTRLLRLSLATVLMISLSAGVIAGPTVTATDHHTCIFFPWVPNGIEIDDPVTGETAGPFYSQITIQNLEPEPISAFLMPHQDCNTANPGGYYQVVLQAMQTVTLDPGNIASLSIPAGEAGPLVVTARTTGDNTKTTRIAAIQRQVSPIKTLDVGRSTQNHVTTSGYTGLTEFEGIGDTLFLPIAQTNNNWNTLIRVSNFDPAFGTQIDLTLHPAGGGAPLGPFSNPAFQGDTVTFDLLDLGVPPEWVGSAEITSDPERQIGAVAERIKVETNMLLMNTSRSAEQPVSSSGFAPLIFRDWNFWNTGVSIGNSSDDPNDVTITFYDIDGVEVFNDSTTIAPKGMEFFYLPAGDGEPFLGSAIVQGSQPLYGAVDEVKYFGDDGDTGHAMSYMLNPGRSAREGDALAFPFYARGNAQTGSHDTSGIQIWNIGGGAAEVEVMFYEWNGTPALAQPDSFVLEPWESRTLYSLDYEELPVNVGAIGFYGSAVVRNVHPGLPGESGLIGVMNLVNYDVQYDGSATYNHTVFSELVICGGNC
jgi:hypothetical protein